MSLAAFKQRLLTESGYVSFVAECEGELLGFVTLKGEEYLYHLFVAQNRHRQGLARELWRYVLARSHADQIKLRASLYAVPVYRQFGFTVDGPVASFDGCSFQAMTWHRQPCV